MISDNATDQPHQPTAELIYLFADTRSHGITVGSPLTVPQGYAALIVMGNRPYDTIGPGEYIIGQQGFPQLAQKLKLQPGQPLKLQPGQPLSKSVDLSVYLMNVTGVSIPWSAVPLVTKDYASGLQYCQMSGQCAIRVHDPAGMYAAFVKDWNKVVKKQSAEVKAQLASMSLGKQAEIFIAAMVEETIAGSLLALKHDPKLMAWPPITLEQTVSTSAVMALQSVGLQCVGFKLNSIPDLRRAPCAKCGSHEAPTAYGVYRRNISIVYVRFTAKREGNFCVPCAAKVSAMYNGVMLVVGWWGYIGLILTPIYLVQNCFHFMRAAFGNKAAAGAMRVAITQEAGVWPPPPIPDWAREVQE